MDEKRSELQDDDETKPGIAHDNDERYHELPDYSTAKQKISKSKAKNKDMLMEHRVFLQACNKLYTTGSKLFSESNYELLRHHPQFAEEIVVALRPALIKAVFGNFIEDESMVADRIFILSVLQKNGILKNVGGKISDQDWIRFLNSIDQEKLDQYARVFEQIDVMTIEDPDFFSRVKTHNDLGSLANELRLNKVYGVHYTIPADAKIKGFTGPIVSVLWVTVGTCVQPSFSKNSTLAIEPE